MRCLVLIGFVILFSAYSCSKEKDLKFTSQKNLISEKDINAEIEQAKDLFKHLYLPVEMSDMFKETSLDYNPLYLKKYDISNEIMLSHELALAMGLYGVDLGYIRLYNEWGAANSYLNVLKGLSERIGISRDVFEGLADYFEKPLYNKDSLEMVANRLYQETDYNLRLNGRSTISALIILGGWLEAIRIGIEMYNDDHSIFILEKICNQNKSLSSVINLLSIKEDNGTINNYLDQMFEIQNYMRGLNAAFVHLVANQNDNFAKETTQNYLNKIDIEIRKILNFANIR